MLSFEGLTQAQRRTDGPHSIIPALAGSAIIMASIFLGLVRSSVPFLNDIGVVLVVAITVDVVVMRILVVPALVQVTPAQWWAFRLE